jgi:carboxypeptidase C (cathepsin A)
MITHSKSSYRKSHPFNTIVFNSNIFILNEDKYTKVWFGDLDISLDGEILKKISQEIKHTLYVVHEMDGRYKNENNQNVLKVQVWNTTQDTPYIDKKTEIELKTKQLLETARREQERIQQYQTEKRISRILPKKEINEIFGRKVVNTLEINEQDITKFFEEEKELFNTLPQDDREEYLNFVFSNHFLDSILPEYLPEIEDTFELNPSALWIGEKFNAYLNQLNWEFDNEIMGNIGEKPNQKFTYSSYLAVLEYNQSNKLCYNNDSMGEYTIYILENYLKN